MLRQTIHTFSCFFLFLNIIVRLFCRAIINQSSYVCRLVQSRPWSRAAVFFCDLKQNKSHWGGVAAEVHLARGKFLVALGTGENDVDPDAHRLGARRHQVVRSLRALDAERQAGVRALHRVQVVHVNFFNGLHNKRVVIKIHRPTNLQPQHFFWNWNWIFYSFLKKITVFNVN